MIPAYHAVPKRAFRKVLGVGHLTPAIERLHPNVFTESCERQISNLGDLLEGKRLDPIGMKVLKNLSSKMIDDLSRWQEESGIEASSEHTQLGCVDFLAKDVENVFLQVGRWPDWGSISPAGFVFNSEDLVERGATFRRRDLAPLYWSGLQKIMTRKFKDVGSAQKAITSMFLEIQRENDLIGSAALKALKERPGRQPAELLWNGRLPIELAVESFHPDLYLEA